MPIHFDSRQTHGRPQPQLQFTQDVARGSGERTSNIGWVVLFAVLLPIVGFFLGIHLFQETRHAAARGRPVSAVYLISLIMATALSVVSGIWVLLLLLLSS